MQVRASGSFNRWAAVGSVALNPDSNSMLQAGPPIWANLPLELLVSVFGALHHPRDLLACACVCKAWKDGKAKAVVPVLNLSVEDLRFLIQLNHVQMAAVKDVHMRLASAGPGYATASAMLFTFVCGRSPTLQRLKVDWGAYTEQKDLQEVGCIAQLMPDMVCETGSSMHFAILQDFGTWQRPDVEMFSAMLPTSLQALDFAHGIVSLPDLRHLTALTELRLDLAVLTPSWGHASAQLPHLPALRLLSFIGAYHAFTWDVREEQIPGPKDLGIANSAPLLAELRFAVGYACSDDLEQLACLAPLGNLKTIVLDFNQDPDDEFSESLLRPDFLLSLPPSVTKLVICGFDSCESDVAMPENIAIVYEESLLDKWPD